jgi:hypothetical protein
MRIARYFVATVLAASVGVVGFSPAAHASIGACYGLGVANPRSESGYCEGSKPSLFWQLVVCVRSTGHEYSVDGPSQWAGGGVGSTATCDAGTYITRSQIVKSP